MEKSKNGKKCKSGGGHSHLIFCAYAEDENKKSGANLSVQHNRRDIYLKNALVALISAKKSNPDCDVALITTIELPVNFFDLCKRYGILVLNHPFNAYVFPDASKWGLAFYKLCAFEYALSLHYDDFLMLDTDTYTQNSLEDLWIETKYHIMLSDTNQRLCLKNAKAFQEEVENFMGEYKPITQYGGEFIAGNKDRLTKLFAECKKIYQDMIDRNIMTNFGDEFILCLAANNLKQDIKCAGGYVFRFWTGEFRLVSTCYKFDAISVLHVPSQKVSGFIKLFDLLEKGIELKPHKVHRILRLDKARWQTRLKQFFGISRDYQ